MSPRCFPRPANCRALVLGLAVFIALVPVSASAELWRWVQYVPGGVEIRAATTAVACPVLSVDGLAAAMTIRAEPDPSFPVRICTARLPAGAKHAAIDGIPLPLPKPHPNRILIVGDTGCRLKFTTQDCNDVAAWPFKLGATLSASLKPDLVLHVGDFHYREKPCPAGNDGCAGSPWGDNWDVWREDFFAPADSLLRAAPWIMVRGNHELCDRGGHGWARALDPEPFDPATGSIGCLPAAKPYTVDIGGVTVMVLDVAAAGEDIVNEAQVPAYRDMFALAAAIPGPVWQTFHRPVWAGKVRDGKSAGADNKTLAAAARGTVPANVQAFISGHIHTFQVAEYVEDLPIQIVSGHGGDDLEAHAAEQVKGLEINGVTVKDGIARPHVFGFSILERTDGDTSGTWRLTAYDIHAQPIATCRIAGRTLDCH